MNSSYRTNTYTNTSTNILCLIAPQYIGIEQGCSEVYYRHVLLLDKFKYFHQEQQTPSQKRVCEHILYGYDLCKDDVHFISFMLDVRFTRWNRFMPGDSIDSFLNLMKNTINDDDEYNNFEREWYKFRRSQAPYNTGITAQARFGGRGIVFENTPERNWKFNQQYWDKIILRFDNDDARKELFKYAKICIKIPTGTEMVENTFSLIKIIHRAQRASLGAKKLRDLIYIVANHRLLKLHNV